MLRLVLNRAALRVAVGLAVVAALPFALPDAPADRLWGLTLAALAAPWLVLGRDARRRADGLREAARIARRTPRLVALELLPALGVVGAGAVVGTGGIAPPAAGLFAWGACLVCVADALDRRAARAGTAWVPLWGGTVAVLTAPLWMAPAFDFGGWSPWPATLAIGLHPAAVALTAAGRAALQDPWFYTLTLSGVVEVRPLPWFWGAALYAALAAAAALLAVRAARRPIGSCR